MFSDSTNSAAFDMTPEASVWGPARRPTGGQGDLRMDAHQGIELYGDVASARPWSPRSVAAMSYTTLND